MKPGTPMHYKSVFASLALCLPCAAQATVVLDPIAHILPGQTAKIGLFTHVPPTSTGGAPRTGAQGLQGLADGSGRIFINDTRGILYVTDKTGAAPTPYLDLRTAGIGFSNAADATQTGLMSFAFHPNFNKDPQKPGYNIFYTIDTSAASNNGKAWGVRGVPANHDNIVHEWHVADPSAATAQVTAVREVLRIAQPYKDHGAGTIAFNSAARPGDADYGKLYIGMGDGGSANDPLNSAQNLTVPFGKILRIDPVDPDGEGPRRYAIPSDNPFAGSAAARGEVWALGLRNPQHFSWDAKGQMYIADIGQAQIEEVDVGRPGANYGWPAREGTYARGPDKDDFAIYNRPPNPGFSDPIGQYDHEEILRFGGKLASIGTAFRYEGSLMPGLFGDVILSDLVSGRLFYFDPDEATSGTPATLHELMLTLNGLPTTLRTLEGYSSANRVDLRLGRDSDGELYMISKGDGAIYRFLGLAVPEPGSWIMMLAGFAAIGGVLRGRRSVGVSTIVCSLPYASITGRQNLGLRPRSLRPHRMTPPVRSNRDSVCPSCELKFEGPIDSMQRFSSL